MVKISLSIVNLQEGEPVPYDYVNFWNIEARKERVPKKTNYYTWTLEESWNMEKIKEKVISLDIRYYNFRVFL